MHKNLKHFLHTLRSCSHSVHFSSSTLIASLYFIMPLSLSACTTANVVKIPVPVACIKPAVPSEPHYPLDDLSTTDAIKPDLVIKAAAVTLKLQHDYIQRLKKLFS